MIQKKLILIAGPTASGKTAMAIHLAKKLQTEIISADSRQCYREMNIGVAKPSAAELAAVKHHFINSHSIHDDVNAAAFAEYAHRAAEKIFANHDTVVMAGGTGLYIKAFCEGLDDIPSVPSAIRENISHLYEQHGIGWLQQQVQSEDPLYFQEGEIHNPRRLMRALEVIRATGRSIRFFQQRKPAEQPFRIFRYGIDIPREQLYHNINQRVGHMMEQGLLDEVRSLEPYKKLNALQTVGYAELFEFLEGNCTLPEAVDRIRQNTRHYAKRQLTWFRKDPEIKWIRSASELEA